MPYRERNKEEDFEQLPNGDEDTYPIQVQRKNVNARFPIGRDFLGYRELMKRFPVSKRSPKLMSNKRQATDPKVIDETVEFYSDCVVRCRKLQIFTLFAKNSENIGKELYGEVM